MSRSLQRIGIVSVATIVSRLLGLARDILAFAVFGTSALHSAFIFAFTLPNLFRRLLGEGALTAALVPTLSEELERNRRAGAFVLFNRIFTWLLLVSTGLVLAAMLFFYAVGWIPGLEARWYIGAELSLVLFPYMVLVCVAAIFAAALNVLNRFAVPALSAVWLNLAMIVALGGFGMWFASTPEERMRLLCLGVIAGGLLQVLIPAWAFAREGWRPAADLSFGPKVREVGKLMLPGLAGAAIFQINVLVSRALAFTLDESAVAVLYLANRLMELPLGIFSIAVTTVMFPLFSRYAARREYGNFAAAYRNGVGLILMITIPAALGLILLREPILACLFQWGAFDASDVGKTLPVLVVFALSLPFYSLAGYITRGFYSLKDTATPVRIAGVSFVVNFILSVTLMQFLGIIGLALANLFSVVVQTSMLQRGFVRRVPGAAFIRRLQDLGKLGTAGLAMGAAVWGMSTAWYAWAPEARWVDFAALALIIPAAIAVYGWLLWMLNVEGRKDMEAIVLRYLRGKRDDGALNL